MNLFIDEFIQILYLVVAKNYVLSDTYWLRKLLPQPFSELPGCLLKMQRSSLAEESVFFKTAPGDSHVSLSLRTTDSGAPKSDVHTGLADLMTLQEVRRGKGDGLGLSFGTTFLNTQRGKGWCKEDGEHRIPRDKVSCPPGSEGGGGSGLGP